MKAEQDLLEKVKASISETEPTATLILFGSYARGDYNQNSDLDLLILVDQEKITMTDRKRITYPLYDIEFDTGILISPMVYSKEDWESRKGKTPFHENVSREGRVL